jgi:hypothetical protein
VRGAARVDYSTPASDERGGKQTADLAAHLAAEQSTDAGLPGREPPVPPLDRRCARSVEASDPAVVRSAQDAVAVGTADTAIRGPELDQRHTIQRTPETVEAEMQ